MRAALFLAVVSLSACAVDDPPSLGAAQQGIIGGTQGKVGQYPTVVAIVEPVAGNLCTGTLITPTAVITAAHCVDPGELGTTAAKIKQDTVVVFDAVVADGQSGTAVTVSDVFENPAHPIYTSADPDFGHDDDAILILSKAITDRTPSPIDLDPDRQQLGVVATQVGYGVDKITSGVGDQNSGGTENVLTGRTVIDCAPFGLTNDNMVCFDQSDNKGQCNGDSGGPSFDANGTVIGVTSFGEPSCLQWGADTRPSQTAAFILSHAPDVTQPPAATPTSGTCGDGHVDSGEQCDDGDRNGATGDACSATCTALSGGGGDGGGGGGGNSDPTTTDNGNVSGGCQAGGSSTGGLVLGLGALGATLLRRRRRTAANPRPPLTW